MQNKVLVLGVDGLDPRLTKKYMEKGVMPNFTKFMKKGSAREDLVMLGALPTITPPMWTTLATGAYAGTHGITDFWNPHPTKLDTLVYSFDSRNCKAEQLWNVTAEAGLKTLVWHWPGSSWPPSSDSPNLHVVDGTQPSNINVAIGTAELGMGYIASSKVKDTTIKEKESDGSGAGCVLTDLEVDEASSGAIGAESFDLALKAKEMVNIMMDEFSGEYAEADVPIYDGRSLLPLKDAKGWENAPEGAKEFIIPANNGLERNPALVLKNEKGIYDRVAIYKSKKAKEPMVVLQDTEKVVSDILDTLVKDGEKVEVARQYKLIRIEPDGSEASLFVGNAMEANNDTLFHPKSILQDIRKNVGELRSVNLMVGLTEEVFKVFLPFWDAYSEWQADCINYMIESKKYDVVFSHLHNIDIIGHNYWELAKHRPEKGEYDEKIYQKAMEVGYSDTDKYLGKFMHLLDEGWDIIITSDHGLICAEEQNKEVALGDPFGINCGIMRELGYTVMKKDENGNDLPEIDWTKTVAVAQRGIYIYINLKGRDPEGIVDPADQYELERKIIDDLYSYRDKHNGKRIICLAVRKKEAAHFGLNSDRCGDIIYFLEEGFNRIHGDSISTYYGYADTSESPIFMAAGPNIKKGFITDRVIREVDVAPTVATLTGVRMPAQCEGAPVYQIFEE